MLGRRVGGGRKGMKGRRGSEGYEGSEGDSHAPALNVPQTDGKGASLFLTSSKKLITLSNHRLPSHNLERKITMGMI